MTSLRTLLPFFALLTLLAASCGGGVHTADDAGAALDAPRTDLDAPTSEADAPRTDFDAAGLDAPATPTDGASPCAYVDTIDRSCTADSDCTVVLHQTDCCGSSVMVGIATTAYPVYGENEPACMASYPGCGCPAGLPTTDSGETVTDTSAVLAACVSRGPRNVCLTYVTMRPLDAP